MTAHSVVLRSRFRRTVRAVDVMDAIKGMFARSFGNDGAVRNCQVEQQSRRRTEAEVDRMCDRLRPTDPGTERPVA
jgi:hypothetical protein